MKSKLTVFLLSLVLAGSLSADELDGRQIMAESERLYNASSEQFVITMTLFDGLVQNSHPDKTIIMRMWLMNQSNPQGVNLQSSLIKITGPASLSGMGVLTVQQSETESLQKIYIPEIGTRTIGSNKKSDRFMTSDITFGDLEPEVLSRWTYTRQPDQVLDGTTCFVLEAVPVNPDDVQNYGYQRRILWLSQNSYFVLKIEYYDQEGQLAKIQLNQDIVQSGEYWRANRLVFQNRARNHLTVLNFSERQINPDLSDGFFSERYLEREVR